MRFLVDAQFPPALVGLLADRGHIAEHVAELGLAAADDRAIWAEAAALGAVIVTKDEDFAIRRVASDAGPPVVWIRRGNTSRRDVLAWFDALLPAVRDALERGERLIEIV